MELSEVIEVVLETNPDATVGDVKAVMKHCEADQNGNWKSNVRQFIKNKQSKEWKQIKRLQSISETTEISWFPKGQN